MVSVYDEWSVYMRVQWILVVSVYEGPVDISGQCI